MEPELREKHIENLIRWSATCLKAFRSGHSPTFNQLDRLELALTPFTTDKLCGHRLDEECDCAELNRIMHVDLIQNEDLPEPYRQTEG
jgi:hypothetical protein